LPSGTQKGQLVNLMMLLLLKKEKKEVKKCFQRITALEVVTVIKIQMKK
jgi:hypothetical protein